MEEPSVTGKRSVQDEALSFLSEIKALITSLPGEVNRRLIFRALRHVPLAVSYVDRDLRRHRVHDHDDRGRYQDAEQWSLLT